MRFIVSIDRRADMHGIPLQFYAYEVVSLGEQPKILSFPLFSSTDPYTLAEMAELFDKVANRFRELELNLSNEEYLQENSTLIVEGNESVN